MKVRQLFNRVLQEIDKYSPSPRLYSFIMTEKEKLLFQKRIKKSKFYLEFGMGGSTFCALQHSHATVYSVESSKDWAKIMRKYVLIKYWERRRLFIFHMDIGPTTPDAGYPDSNASSALFPDYSANIFKLIDKTTLDTILVDGRFRVACTLKAIAECYANENLQILIHDFWNRKEYHVLLKYLIEIERVDTLGVFKVKGNPDLQLIEEEYDAYKYNPF
jgi:hypothetical protein